MPSCHRNASRRPGFSNQFQSAPWTAARCNRVLRQLTTFLVKIEKWHNNSKHQQTLPIKQLCPEKSRLRKALREQGNVPEKRSTYENDPEWVLQLDPLPRKRQKRYGAKQHKDNPESRKLLGKLAKLPRTPKSSKSRSGEISLDTPLIVGAFPAASHGPLAEESRKGRLGRSKQPKQKIIRDANSHGDYKTLVQGLLVVVQTFLDTTKEENAHRRGVRSLLAMCQRKMPDCIVEEQEAYIAQKEEGDDIQVASRLFAELEDVFSNGAGWKPLRGIVRSHGLKLLCYAIEHEHLDLSAAALLARQSADLGHVDAYETFSNSLLFAAMLNFRIRSKIATLSQPEEVIKEWLRNDDLYTQYEAENITVSKLCAIQDAMKKDQRHRFLLCLLSSDTTLVRSSLSLLTGGGAAMASGGSLLHTFLLRTLDILRSDIAVHSLRLFNSGGDGSLTEESILEGQVLASEANSFASQISGEHSRSVNATTRSIFTLITSTGLIRQRKRSAHDHVLHTTLHLVDDLLIQVRQQRELCTSPISSPDSNSNLLYILILHILLSDRDPRRIDIESILFFEEDVRRMSPKSELIARGASFLLDIACCCGRVERSDGFSVLKGAIDRFGSLRNSKYPTLSTMMQHTAVTAVISFAQRYDRPSYYEWASEVQRRFSALIQGQGLSVSETPTLARKWTTYLWDESIEEWIAETPLLKQDAPSPHPQAVQTLDTPAPRREVRQRLNHMIEQAQETPTPDLLGLPSPPATSSPSDESPVAVRLRRKSDGLAHGNDQSRTRNMKRNYSCGNAAELQDIERTKPSKKRHQRPRHRVQIHVDGDCDELAPTPKTQATKCRPVLRINGLRGNRSQKATVSKVIEGTRSDSEDELGVL